MHFHPSFFRLVRIHVQSLLRNPICMLITITAVMATIIMPLVFTHTFGDTASRLARDGGLAFHLVAGIALAAYAACSLSGCARQSGTDAMILVKPISPSTVFLARYAGVALVLLIFSATSGLASMLAQRIAESFSPSTGRHLDLTTATSAVLGILLVCGLGVLADATRKATFHTTVFCLLPLALGTAALLSGFHDRAGNWTRESRYTLDTSSLVAALLIAAALLLVAALALTLSLWLSPASVAATCFILLVAGLSVDWLLATTCQNTIARTLVLATIPNWQRFWGPATSQQIPLQRVAGVLFYAILYTSAVLLMGCHRYERSEHA